MSKWYKTKKEDISLSDDGEEINVYIDSDEFGSIYTEIKVKDIKELLIRGDNLEAQRNLRQSVKTIDK